MLNNIPNRGTLHDLQANARHQARGDVREKTIEHAPSTTRAHGNAFVPFKQNQKIKFVQSLLVAIDVDHVSCGTSYLAGRQIKGLVESKASTVAPLVDQLEEQFPYRHVLGRGTGAEADLATQLQRDCRAPSWRRNRGDQR